MRKQIVAGNWKMNTNINEGVELAKMIIEKVSSANKDVELILIPPFTHISDVAKQTKGTTLKVGAQNCAEWAKGAYTGEVSASMISSIGATHVIIGHSERREFFKEDNHLLFRKINEVLNNGLIPIYCCGEKLEQRESNQYFEVVEQQIAESLFELNKVQMQQVVIAYEPVWAIGTGRNATAEQAQEMHEFIRKTIASKFGKEIADGISILYGGSCKPSNAAEIFAKPDVDGGLIGGASLVADDFIAIAQSF
ncbi:MAG: triose-phosphate isomerase [Bacteroidales bacterium]|nr:MAG: triose-phosphate isomerase [Bacteroidales bacterium]